MKKVIAAVVVALSFINYSSAADDLTSLARPTVRGGASN
jgi:hypothetical protein